ncbi:uncharacterized protein LOC143039796 [Oratosquilla oratoria]|uniref:uncharacterized protein LOC143039796 n=1 Tax=Oratosquilla oratoria TaxID=337810 RepID=UPI003F776760
MGYTVFWEGKVPEEPHIHSVGFAIRSQLVQQHNFAPTAINERLMTDRIPLTQDKHLTPISVYAPSDEEKAAFYNQLNHTTQAVPANDKRGVVGDFNARVSKDHRQWEGIIGHHGIGSCNANGQLLLGLCAEHEFIVANTLFRLPKRQKTTWKYSQSKHWHILVYVLTKARNQKDIRITRSMLGTDDCWTDHRLLISRLNIKTQRPPRRAPGSILRRRFEYVRLHNPQMVRSYKEAYERHLVNPVNQASVEDHWTTLRDAMTRAAEETISFARKKHQDWFDEDDETVSLLIEAKRQTRLHLKNQLIKSSDQRDLRSFYAATKEIFGPTRSSVGGLKDVDEATIITDSEGILLRCRTHFENLLNDQANTPSDLLRITPQDPVHHWMSLLDSIQDFNRALKRMKPNKAPGPDNIPLELLTHGGPELKNRLMLLILKIWEMTPPPSDFRDANIITIFRKGDRENCNNYHGILLLSITSKIFAHFLLDRLFILARDVLPESQCGFRPFRGTIDIIFCARQLQEL